MRDELYPAIEPYKTGYINLDGLHQMYWEESGNPDGVPIVVLHGGPGAGSSPLQRCFFDPGYYRIIIFDQRGAGKSLPLGELKDNTTPHLIEDIEHLRQFLNVESWYVFGGSWGATLAIAYAEVYPKPCLGLILRGTFLCRRSEFEWVLWGAKSIFPEAHQKFLEPLELKDRKNWRTVLEAYYTKLTLSEPDIYIPFAKVWSIYEATLSTLLPCKETLETFESEAVAIGLARIETHYFMHDIFLAENDLLNKIDRIRHIPGYIIHGRYDIVCPIITSDDVVKKWPEVDYRIIPDAGHSSFEPGIRKELVRVMEEIKIKQRERKVS